MGRSDQILRTIKPYLAMVFLQISLAVMYILIMVSFNHGLSHFILSVYRHAVATFVLAPFALLLERKIRPPMTFPIFLRIALLGFLEPVLDQNLCYLGMKYTSATFASTASNTIPAITFIIALIFRLESVNIKKKHSLAKVAGTVITLAGAMTMTLYKGPALNILAGDHTLITQNKTANESADHHWVKGTIFVLISCCGWSTFYILQSLTLKVYPAELSLAALICFAGMVEGGAVTLAVERNMGIWVIGWDSRLLAVVYTGVVCSGIAYYVQGVVIKRRGPVFVTSFSPLSMIITAALGTIFLAEKIHLGSVIGAIIIVLGLYTVLWGKSKDFESSKVSNALRQLSITTTVDFSDRNGDQATRKTVETPTKSPINSPISEIIM